MKMAIVRLVMLCGTATWGAIEMGDELLAVASILLGLSLLRELVGR